MVALSRIVALLALCSTLSSGSPLDSAESARAWGDYFSEAAWLDSASLVPDFQGIALRRLAETAENNLGDPARAYEALDRYMLCYAAGHEIPIVNNRLERLNAIRGEWAAWGAFRKILYTETDNAVRGKKLQVLAKDRSLSFRKDILANAVAAFSAAQQYGNGAAMAHERLRIDSAAQSDPSIVKQAVILDHLAWFERFMQGGCFVAVLLLVASGVASMRNGLRVSKKTMGALAVLFATFFAAGVGAWFLSRAHSDLHSPYTLVHLAVIGCIAVFFALTAALSKLPSPLAALSAGIATAGCIAALLWYTTPQRELIDVFIEYSTGNYRGKK